MTWDYGVQWSWLWWGVGIDVNVNDPIRMLSLQLGPLRAWVGWWAW